MLIYLRICDLSMYSRLGALLSVVVEMPCVCACVRARMCVRVCVRLSHLVSDWNLDRRPIETPRRNERVVLRGVSSLASVNEA